MKQLGKPFKRPNRKGYFLRWTDPVTHKRLTKAFPTKTLANHFKQILYYQFNADVYIGAINIPLSQAINEYLEKYELRNLSKSAKIDVAATLQRFIDITGDIGTKYLTQQHFDGYIKKRKDGISVYTLNKDIGNLKAFLNWANKARYIKADIELSKVKTPPLNHKALTTKQIRLLFKRCPTPAWRCRILLSLVTGLRKTDVDNLNRSSIDLKAAKIDTVSQKTQKVYINRPLPILAIPELRNYLKSLSEKQTKLFADVNTRKEWDRIRGDSGITRQDLRITFSTLIQKIGSIGSAKELLEHYSEKTTTEFYTDQELILRWKVNQLPVRDWLKRL